MRTASDIQEETLPLCVDLDGTLVNTDTLIESGLLLLKQNPLYVFALFFWLLSGKAHLKEQISSRTHLNVGALPYNQPLLDWLQVQRAHGRPLVLVTAASQRIADSVAGHLDMFTLAIGSTAENNLSAGNKRDELDRRYGRGKYDYAGNASDDLEVWSHCHRAIVVNASASLLTHARQVAAVEHVIGNQRSVVALTVSAMRVHQWSKNLLIFVNVLMAHQLSNIALMGSTAVAFVAFCLCASSVYLINDLFDLDVDREHMSKRNRPFASGAIPLAVGIVVAPSLLFLAIVLAAIAGGEFLLCLLVYFGITAAYSLYLKRIVLLDVLVLAILYTLRIVAGAAVAGVMPSFWLMSFSLFIFTSLAMAKRYAELKSLEDDPTAWASGRGYHVGDLAIISSLGVAAGYIATLVLALYINSPAVLQLYTDGSLIWLLCPLLLYWIGRIWLLATRGELNQDPVIFATRDPVSYLVAVLGLLTLWAAV